MVALLRPCPLLISVLLSLPSDILSLLFFVCLISSSLFSLCALCFFLMPPLLLVPFQIQQNQLASSQKLIGVVLYDGLTKLDSWCLVGAGCGVFWRSVYHTNHVGVVHVEVVERLLVERFFGYIGGYLGLRWRGFASWWFSLVVLSFNTLLLRLHHRDH